MKNLKLTRKVQIILITIFVIITGVIIVSIVSNDRLMGYADTELGTAKSAKPSELFDEAGTNVEGLHIGDFVNYDAGTWTQEEIDAIQTGEKGKLVGANGTNSLPTESYQFGGFSAGSSKNGNAVPFIGLGASYTDYLIDKQKKEKITGWRVFDVVGDTVTLISAGNPEDYFHPDGEYAYQTEYILTGKVNSSWSTSEAARYQKRDWDNYVNAAQKAVSATVVTENKYNSWFTKYIGMTSSSMSEPTNFRKIYSEPYIKYQNIVDNNSFYSLFTPEIDPEFDGKLLFVNTYGREVSCDEGFALGVRILITLSSDVMFSSEKVETKTITGGNMSEYGGAQTYNVWDIVEEKHGPSENIIDYKRTDTGHTPIYECTVTGCDETYEGTEEAHTGGTHENGGICTVEGCKYKYQNHEQSDTPEEYRPTETGHIPIYACTQSGCTATYEEEEEAHNNETWKDNEDGTHSSICTKCDAITTENHNYEDGKCKKCGADEPEIDIDPGEYEILEAYITQIQPGTIVSTLKNNITTNAEEINIYNLNNELLKDTDIIGTGMKLELKKGNQIKNFTLIARGDVNGDGALGMADILIINQYRLNKRSLEEIYLIAGDVTGDGKVDFFDIIKMNRFKLHKIIEL